MIRIEEGKLRNLVRDAYLKTITEGRDHDREIIGLILALKDTLSRRNFVCSISFTNTDTKAPFKRLKFTKTKGP